MIRWFGNPPKVQGFVFYPLWEVIFGIFVIIMAFLVPILFFRYNGFQTRQYLEWLFCGVFFVFFLFMGKSLVFQSFKGTINDGILQISQTLRYPPITFEKPVREIVEFKIGEAVDEQGNTYKTLIVVSREGFQEVYRSIDPSEIEEIKNALNTLCK